MDLRHRNQEKVERKMAPNGNEGIASRCEVNKWLSQKLFLRARMGMKENITDKIRKKRLFRYVHARQVKLADGSTKY